MSTRSLYLYQPLGGAKTPSSPLRDVLCNPVRCTAILVIVVLSLTSIGLTLVQRPWSSLVAPNTFAAPTVPVPVPEPPIVETLAATVYHPFLSPSPAQAIADPIVRPIKAHSFLSDECLDTWVASGKWQEPCRHSMVQEAHIDLVYVWVNGSDVLHQQARKALLKATGYHTKEARFREHDELRYSLRAARNATASWPNSTWHIIAADVPDPDSNVNDTSTVHQRRLGLVPQWLDVECAYHGAETQAPIRFQHDTQLFHLTGEPGAALQAKDAEEWLAKILPSFNSHAVESQLPQLSPHFVSDNIVALNDDQFFLLPLPPSAFHSTLYGQVFRIDPNLLVGGDSTGRADGGGEWRSLGWSSHLLNERFGTRSRPYMHHNARALSLPLLHEVSLAFGGYFAATPLSQFRGSHKVAGEYEVNTIFMATHYVIERHREALLWAWVVAKWGGAHGVLGVEQKEAMWAELGAGQDEGVLTLGKAARTTGEDADLNMLMAGLQPPHSHSFDDEEPRQADTAYTWLSMDGYSASFQSLASVTEINWNECIGDETEPAWDMFRRLLKDNRACGDNVISALIHSTSSGLGIFLPAPSPHSTTSPLPSEPIILPFELSATAPPLPANPRAFAVRLLMRYAYVLGDSATRFVGMKSATQLTRLLNEANLPGDVALLCINDDLPGWAQRDANAALKTFLRGGGRRRWFVRGSVA
ncbi:hypothetical protein B0H10DRAFT_1322834 [Mycena sp. CBHHK59/15]|nr:hypothetical protein B0H10DRAFT_1322834 [Mycena sp. CBHHK59/15]